jgi:hypothetical protein
MLRGCWVTFRAGGGPGGGGNIGDGRDKVSVVDAATQLKFHYVYKLVAGPLFFRRCVGCGLRVWKADPRLSQDRLFEGQQGGRALTCPSRVLRLAASMGCTREVHGRW